MTDSITREYREREKAGHGLNRDDLGRMQERARHVRRTLRAEAKDGSGIGLDAAERLAHLLGVTEARLSHGGV